MQREADADTDGRTPRLTCGRPAVMERYRVTDGDGFRLGNWATDETSGVAGKAEGRAEVAELSARLDELQELFYADGRHRLLVVLQGTDTAGSLRRSANTVLTRA